MKARDDWYVSHMTLFEDLNKAIKERYEMIGHAVESERKSQHMARAFEERVDEMVEARAAEMTVEEAQEINSKPDDSAEKDYNDEEVEEAIETAAEEAAEEAPAEETAEPAEEAPVEEAQQKRPHRHRRQLGAMTKTLGLTTRWYHGRPCKGRARSSLDYLHDGH